MGHVQFMLETLRIQNYALIDDIEVSFRSGFNVLTGETGAGKSIIVGALNLILGARASSEALRDGARQGRVDAVFRLPSASRRLTEQLRQRDIEIDDDELILSRIITAEGRSRAYVAGNLVPVSVLAEVGDELVDIHGQHTHQSLLKPDRQLELLDAFAGSEGIVDEVAALVAELRRLGKAIAELESDDRERLRRVEFLRFEVNEINAANLEPGEEEELRARRNIIANAERICALASQARAVLYEGDESSAIVAVDSALGSLGELAGIDERFAPLVEQLSDVRASIEDIATQIRDHTSRLEFNPRELDELNERLDLIAKLKRKYGNTIEAILEYRDKAAVEINAFESRDKRFAEMQAQREKLREKTLKTARTLREKRKKAARRLDKQVTGALRELGMKVGRFKVAVSESDLTSTGIDRVEFFFSANPGEKVAPLRQVASGGEMSRVMLALKAVFAEADKIPTLIFDEIDAGVGGHIAGNVANKLRQLAQSHQTISITHIPQIAAAAQTHYRVSKSTHKIQGTPRTATSVTRVEGEARVEEIARLLDGSVSEVSLGHARELLKHVDDE